MTQQIVNVGSVAGDGTGDDGQVPFNKTNANFTELYGTAFYFGVDSGTAGAYVITTASLKPNPTGYTLATGTIVRFTPLNANPGAATLQFASAPAIAVVNSAGAALTGGEFSPTTPAILEYNGTAWQFLSGGSTLGFYPRTASEIAASVTPTYYQYQEGNALRYGADSSGVTPSDTAARAAVAVMAAACVLSGGVSGLGNHVAPYFPHGQYTFTTSSVFQNPLFPTIIRGALIKGDGNGSTVFYLKTGGATTLWFFDGTSTGGPSGTHPGVQNMLGWTFRDICFMSDNAAFGNGFNLFSDQGGRFENCQFLNLDVLTATSAASGQGFGGDSWVFQNCLFSNITGAIGSFNNNQAYNWQYRGCNALSIAGDVFKVGVNGGGGGGVVDGGFWQMNGTNQTYFLQIAANASLADANNTFTFNALDITLSTQTACLVTTGATGDEAPLITFNDLALQETGGTAGKVTVNIVEAHLVFNRGTFTANQGSIYRVTGPASAGGQYGDPGSIIWNGSEVFANLSTFCSTPNSADGLPWGYISARDCFASSYTSGTAVNIRQAIDFDLNWQNQGRASNGPRIKRATINVGNYAWPATTGGGSYPYWLVGLPQPSVEGLSCATIVRITGYRAPTGSSVAGFNLYCGNGTGGASGSSVTYASVTGSNTNAGQTLDFNAYDNLGNAVPVTNLQTSQVQIWTTTAGVTNAEVGSAGIPVIVEYI